MNYQIAKEWSLVGALGVLVAVIQMTVFNPLGFWWADLNLILVAIIIAAMIITPEKLLWLAVVAGLVLDLYSALPFGLLTILAIGVAVGASVLLSTVFTNRSLYTLIVLVLIITVGYHLCMFILLQLTNLIGWSDIYLGWSYLRLIGHQLVANAIFAAGLFYAFNRLSRWFKPIFIRS